MLNYLQQAIFHWNIYASEFYPKSLGEKTTFIGCPEITTVYPVDQVWALEELKYLLLLISCVHGNNEMQQLITYSY